MSVVEINQEWLEQLSKMADDAEFWFDQLQGVVLESKNKEAINSLTEMARMIGYAQSAEFLLTTNNSNGGNADE